MLLLAALLLQPPAAGLPADWQGVWRGTLTIGSGPKAQAAPLVLAVKLLAGGRATWAAVHADGTAKRVEKAYEIAPTDQPGVFEIDEMSGVRLRAKLSADGATLATLFRAGDQFIHTTYTRAGDTLGSRSPCSPPPTRSPPPGWRHSRRRRRRVRS